MKNYGGVMVDENTPLTKTLPPDYVYMTNPNRLYRKQVHQFQCCICAAVLAVFTTALAITILYSVDEDIIDNIPDLPADNASLQLLLSKAWPIPDNGVPEWQIAVPTPEELQKAIEDGKSSLETRDGMEASNPSLPINSPSYRHQVSIKTSARATNLARSAYVMEMATKSFVLNKKLNNFTKSVGRGPALTTSWLPSLECGEGPLPPCPPTKYRTIDGSCNNPYKPNKWGVAMRPYRRQIAPDYADGISKPRVSTDGSPLPSARDVSVTVHRPAYRDDPKFTVMLAVWGQFMDHDVTATALSLGAGGKPISCCQNTSSPAHPECFPVYLSPDDPYYQQFGLTCMEFVRSAPAPTCSLGPREQLNQVSSFIDASVVYGNTAELSRSLRSYQGGQLKMLETPDGRTLLPISTNLDDGCNREAENAQGRYCFMTGDSRANENTHLTSLHLLLARQHNLLATELSDINPDWNDEKVYQEARKIVAAQMQHITYNEFLPVLLGPDMMEQLDLKPQKSGYYKDYNPTVDATISNNFATSAFRFAHTLLPALMKTVAKDWDSEEAVEMHKMLFDPFKLYQVGALDKMLQGAISTRLERADSYFNTQVTQHLFQATGTDESPTAPRYGLDLVSLNVQRGRDHGLPAYPVWREYCGLKRPKTFDDMVGMVDDGSLERMKTLYKSVDDIDMYTGALSEFPVEGGLVGATITCLVSDQFKRLKQGDRFWYETDQQPQAFSPAQLDEIRKTTLANIICDTSDEVTTIQPLVMRSLSLNNSRVPCSSLPRPDLTEWADFSKEPSKKSVGEKYTRIEVNVTGGSIKTSSGELLWDGTIPVVVPIPLFNIKPVPILQAPPGPGVFGHGVQWQGTVSSNMNGIEISGEFSYPVYSHGPVLPFELYSVKWVNGQFKLSAIITSNITDISELDLPVSYESPIYFSDLKTNVSGTEGTPVFTTAESPLVIGVQKLPIILTGSKSPDKTSFFWTGNAVLNIPKAPPAPFYPSLASSAISDKTSSVSGWFNVAGGNVKLESADGSTTDLWSGELPVAIPLPLPYKFLMEPQTGEKLIVFGNGLVWSASITGSYLEGSFSFPQYNRTVGSVSVNWLGGQFSLQVSPLMNTSLEELLTPGVKYTSRIIFRQAPVYTALQLDSIFSDDIDSPDSIEDLVVESQQVIDGIIPAPIILFGTFSPDKTIFYFNGKLILAVKPTKPKLEKQLKFLSGPELSFPPWGIPKFGGSVNTGYITAGLDGSSASKVWSGTFPAAIPVPTFFSPLYDELGGKSFIFGNGIVWSGLLSGSTIKGTYSLPQTIISMTGITQQTWTGDFSFELSPLWNTTLGSLFVSGAKYYSKIHFQGAKVEPGVSSLVGVPGEDSSVTMSAPIILQGTYSLDKTTFYWSGSFIVVFHNKPILMFNIPKSPVGKSDGTKQTSISIDIATGSIVAGFTGAEFKEVWSGNLPATIPYSSLISKDSWSSIPSPNVTWIGEVMGDTFKGTFAVPTFTQNGTLEVTNWWTGNFSFKYTPKYGKLLDDYVRSGKKNIFKVIFANPKKLSLNQEETGTGSAMAAFTQEAQEILDDTKVGRLILIGDFYSKPFYCYILPFCSDKQEYYWSGAATLVFPDPPKNKTGNELKMAGINSIPAANKISPQFGGQVVSGHIEGGVTGGSSSLWWSGNLPVQIPTSIFWANTTKQSSSLNGGSHRIEWSGTLLGNTLTGSFSFPQLVFNYPVPTVQWWSGKFSFDVQPLWNTSLDGMIISETTYSSGIYFQGLKTTFEEDNKPTIAKTDNYGKQLAPIILQGTLSPDGSSFLWSGKFIISMKTFPDYSSLTLLKTKDDAPTNNNLKPKTTVSFTVISGQLSASNGSDPIELWNGLMPIDINTDMFNPLKTPGAGVSFDWSPEVVSPHLSGSFSVRVFSRNNSVLMPVSWSGNFTVHYLIKWSGSFDSVVKPGQKYSCSVIFKDLAKSLQIKEPGYIAESIPKQFILGDIKSSGTPCTLILTGKSYTKNENPFYCRVVPFMCSNKPPSSWFSFNGEALMLVKPPANMSPDKIVLGSTDPPSNQAFIRRINTTVTSGSIVAGPESGYPTTLWSGDFPINIPMPVFWSSEESIDDTKLPLDEILHPHGVIWSGSQMGPRIEGSFSLPQYTKTGVTWWTGRFSFLFETNWGSLGDLDEIILPGVNYNSRIVFRDIQNAPSLLSPSQLDIDTATKMPIILLGRYSLDRKFFYWSGNVIINIRSTPSSFVIPPKHKLGKPSIWPAKSGQRVGALVSSASITNRTNGLPLPLWTGSTPVTFPISNFNVSKGVDVIWSASTLYPKFTGNFSIPKYVKGSKTFDIEWIDGTFSFDLITLWNTSLDVIEIGKEYVTIIGSNITKLTKADQEEMFSSVQSLIEQSADLSGSELGKLTLKGSLSPDKLYFTWPGEAWFYPNKSKSDASKPKLQSSLEPSLRFSQYGGAVYDGSVTTGTSGFFSLTHTVWSGDLPATIPFSAFWSGSFFDSLKITKSVQWTATKVSDTVLSGSYTVPQFSWNGFMKTVTYHKGNFEFYVRPLWNASLSSIIEPGKTYSSRISFQGETLLESAQEAVVDPLIISAPLVLQGTYSPDGTAFLWSGNFILNVNNKTKLSL